MTPFHVEGANGATRGLTGFRIVGSGGEVGNVVVARARQRVACSIEGWPARASDIPAGADRAAWPERSSTQAARARAADPHPAIRSVVDLRLGPEARPHSAQLLEEVGRLLLMDGARRLDIRMRQGHPLAAWLHGDRWVQGTVGDDLIASLAIEYPWASAESDASGAASQGAWLEAVPPGVRRLARRTSGLHPRQIPEVVTTALAEIGGAIRTRSTPGTHRSHPVSGAPVGTHPFAASRYRTVRLALSLVPQSLRSRRSLMLSC